jgi:hypothetical protein
VNRVGVNKEVNRVGAVNVTYFLTGVEILENDMEIFFKWVCIWTAYATILTFIVLLVLLICGVIGRGEAAVAPTPNTYMPSGTAQLEVPVR